MRQLADTVIDVDAITLKRLILKLDNLEKALRELRRLQVAESYQCQPRTLRLMMVR